MFANPIATALLAWYGQAYRRLPWRLPPGSTATPDAYRVWLSEIMLQQTNVAAVVPYFEAFTARWPTVESLAAADDADVMAAWAGLGYYARARNMLASARIVAAGGGAFPDTGSALRALPGIGDYTAAAIAAIAFRHSAVVVDGNVERVVARLFAVEAPLPGSKSDLRKLAATITPAERAGDFAQAMMDLGAGVCRPKLPLCASCPLAGHCQAQSAGTAGELPRRAPRAGRPVRYANAYFLHDSAQFLLVRRPPKGLLGGMLALPMSAFSDDGDAKTIFPSTPVLVSWSKLTGEIRHIFTHFELRLSVYSAFIPAHSRPPGVWADKDRKGLIGLPALFHKAAAAAMGSLPIE